MTYLKPNRILLLIAGLMVVMVVAAQQPPPSAAQASISAPASAPAATPAPANAAATVLGAKGPYPGTYIFLDTGDVAPNQAKFIGAHMKFFWSDIELARDYFDWSSIDEWLDEQSSLGKPGVIGISLYDGRCCGGQHTPRWLQWQNPDAIVRCDAVGWPIPRYWHPQVLSEYREFILALAQRYDGDPRVAWIEMGTGIFGEAKPADSWDWTCLLSEGLTAEVWIETSMHMLDYYAAAFKETPVLYQFAPVYTPEGESMRQRRELTDYAAGLGIGVKHNGLEPDTTTAIVDDPAKSYHKAGQWDPFFTHWQTVPTGWESYASQKCLDPVTGAGSAGITMWCVYAGLNAHADYFVFDKALVTDPGRQVYLAFAQHYLGAEIDTTDSVWVALREHEPRAGDFFPPRGNFGMWLVQNDAVPGGRTAAVWNKGPHLEGRYTRRTNRAGGNPDMYFDVNNGWLYQNGDTAVTVEVIYLDEGTDTWSLHYDATDTVNKAAGTVRKTNTGQWLTQTFTLPDAYFGDRLPGGGGHPGSDFYLSSNETDDFFHRIRVFKAGVAPTPTPQPIVTATPSPTPNPGTTSAPTYLRLRDGVSGFGGTADTWVGGNACSKVDGDLGTTPHGSSDRLSLRASGDESAVGICNVLLRFDLGRVPRGSQILSARLVVKGIKQSNAARLYFNTFEVLKPWREDQTTYYLAQAGKPWTKPGADSPGDHPTPQYDTSVLSGPAEQTGWGSAYITPLVQRWVNDPSSNNGVLLLPFGNPVQWDLASSENPEVRWRPALEILYYGPGNPAPTATPTPSATPTPTMTPTPTITSSPTVTLSPSLTPTPTLTPSATPTPSPTPATGIIRGATFYDLNQNQEHDADEAGIADVRIDLLRPGGDGIAAFTATDGSFSFPDLPPGRYVLSEEQPEGWGPPRPGSPLAVLVIANHAHQLGFAHQPLPTATATPSVLPVQQLWLPRYLR